MTDSLSSTNWNDLCTFLAVARSKSLRGAARTLKVNHATVARRIGSLEGALEARLFDRKPEGFFLSQAGEILMASAEKMEEEILSVERKIAGRDTKPTGTVRVSVPPAMLRSFMATELVEFTRQYPDIEIDVEASHSYSDIARGEADVSIRMAKEVTDDLLGRRVIQYSKAIYASREFLRDFNPVDLSRHFWIGWGEDLPYPNWTKDTPFPELAVRHSIFSNILQIEAAKEGLGLSLLPCFLGDSEEGLQRVPGTEVYPSNSIWILLHRDLQKTARIRAFVDFMVTAIKKYRPLIEGNQGRKG